MCRSGAAPLRAVRLSPRCRASEVAKALPDVEVGLGRRREYRLEPLVEVSGGSDGGKVIAAELTEGGSVGDKIRLCCRTVEEEMWDVLPRPLAHPAVWGFKPVEAAWSIF